MHVKMFPASQKPGLQPALNVLFAKLHLLPPHDDQIDDQIVCASPQKTVVCSIVFVAKVVAKVVHVVHSHISDWILA